MPHDARNGTAYIGGGKQMKILKQLIKRNIAGDIILVPVGDASLEIKGLITLNET